MVATGAKYVSQLAVTDPTLPILPPDSVMPFSTNLASGVIGLWDMAHSSATVPPGIASGLVVPNVAFAQAKALIGASSAADLALTFAPDAAFVNGTHGHFERSGKGGIHGIMSKLNNTAGGQGAALLMTDSVTSPWGWLRGNPTHSYYLSLWDTLTRVAAAGTGALAQVASSTSSAANHLIQFSAWSSVPGNLGAFTSATPNTLGAACIQGAQGPYIGNVALLGNTDACGGAMWGTATRGNKYSTVNSNPSHIFYRLYLEDLTVSGRTFAQVSALDAAAYTAAFAVGGRFNADTYTAVSTLP